MALLRSSSLSESDIFAVVTGLHVSKVCSDRERCSA
jgi:hypothetical protein